MGPVQFKNFLSLEVGVSNFSPPSLSAQGSLQDLQKPQFCGHCFFPLKGEVVFQSKSHKL